MSETLATIIKSIVKIGERFAVERFYHLRKINFMTPQIRAALRLVPFKAYVRFHVRL